MIELKKLLLKNFKSFKNAEIPLKPGLTAIVGENGHGKSNIADAMLFVLGETSTKLLRAPRLSDLINYNAKEKIARVTLEFEHSGKKHEISRIIDKEGRSFYRWNGKRASMGEIVSFFEDIGLKTNYNIILQNMTTKVLDISGEQRRKMIEDIAGISEYEEKKQEALKNLEQVERKLRDANILYSEKQNILSELKKEKEAAETAIKLEKEIKKIRAQLIATKQQHLKEEKKEAEKQLSSLEAELSLLEHQKEKSLKIISDLKEKLDSLEKNLFESFDKEHSSLSSQLSHKESSLFEIQKELSVLESALSQKESQLSDLKKQISSLTAQISEYTQQLKDLKENKNSTSASLESLKSKAEEQQISVVFEKISSLEKELTNIENQLSKEKEEYMRKNIFLSSLKEQKNRILKNLKSFEDKLSLLKENLSKSKSALKELSALKKTLEQKKEIESKIFKKTSLLEQLKAKRKDFEKRAEALTSVSSLCPTCSRPLSQKKKTELSNELKTEIYSLKTKEKKISSDLSSLYEKLDSLKKMEAKEKELEEKTSNISFLKKEKEKISAEIDSLKTKLKDIEQKASGQNLLSFSEKISFLENKRDSIKTQLSNLRKSKEISERDKLSSKISEYSSALASLSEKIKIISDVLSEKKSLLSNLKKQHSTLLKETKENKTRYKELKKQIKTLIEEKTDISKKISSLEKSKEKDIRERKTLKKKLNLEESNLSALEIKIKKKEESINDSKLLLSSLDVKLESLAEDFISVQSNLSSAYSSYSLSELDSLLSDYTKRREAMGSVNYKAVEKYNKAYEDFGQISEKIEIINKEKESILDLISNIELKRDKLFLDTLESINKHFSHIFNILFDGNGELVLSNPEKPLESELLFKGRTPLKQYKSIEEMSGGEKALTASAFLFAISLHKPSPFYFFDEMDAPLDKKKSERFASLLEELAAKNHLLVITHNNVILSKADQLIGVGIGKDGSSIITLEL